MIPIILIAVASGVIANYQANSIRQSYDVDTNTMQQILTNPIQIMNRVTRGVYNDIKLVALKNPKKLEDIKFMERLNKELKGKYSYVVLRKNSEFLYVGNNEKLKLIQKSLPNFGVYNTDVDGGIYVGGKYPFLVKQQDFYYEDGGEGSVFVITDVNTLVPQIKSSAIQFVISFVIIICLTATVLVYWIYKSLLSPLSTLRIATNKMKDGNLNFSIQTNTDDEIGMLCEDFEEMRKRLKELIEARMEYEVDMRELISNISHDLKTPLTAIKGYAEGIMDGVADSPEKMDKYLRTICTKATDMTVLVEELSIYSKIDCNTIPYTFANISLDDFFSDCIEELSLDLELKNIDIGYFNYIDTSINVIADAEQLKRVINNIIGNSAKYIGRKGIINVRINDADNEVQIEIEDNGKGISKKDLPYIFDRFYRTDTSRNSSQGGSGLGLAISKKIIEDHGGRIWASSKEEVGTTIYFTLKKSAQINQDGENQEENKGISDNKKGKRDKKRSQKGDLKDE